MPRKKYAISVAIAGCFVWATANGQEFGVNMGSQVRDLSVIESQGDNQYKINPPLPDILYGEYIVLATNEDGVCKIRAIGKYNEDDEAGVEVRRQFYTASESLKKVYGDSSSFENSATDIALYAESLGLNDE